MDENKITALVENIEIFLETSSKNNEKILKVINDLKNDPKSAQILSQASERIKTMSDEFSGLISKQKQQIENFKPEVNIKNYTLDVKNPLLWVGCCFLISFISVMSAVYFTNSANKDRDEWKELAGDRRDNSYKYRYLRLFGNPGTAQEINKLDIDYETNYKICDSLTITRERLLKKKEELDRLAKIKLSEAKALARKADSLRNGR